MAPKIVIIGAGSASFGSNIVATVLRSEILKGATIALVDYDEIALNNMAQLARVMNQEWNAEMRILSSRDRLDLLDGAHFVIVSIEVPPREFLWRLDWEIPVKHGLRQPYGENGGPGGFMHTCRQIPPFMEIVRDMEKACPDAWLINFSNPLPRITRAITKFSKIKTIGKCHQLDVGYGIAAALLADHFGYEVPENIDLHSDPANSRQIIEMAQLGRQQVTITAAGLNHFTWILDIRDKRSGQDLYPYFRAAAEDAPVGVEPFSMELFRLFGYCPVPGDSHLCEYLPWSHDTVARPWEHYNIRLYDWEANELYRESSHNLIARMAGGEIPIDGMIDVPSEGAAEIMEAMIGGEVLFDEAINVPNEGAIPNLPDETIVEVPGRISRQGAETIALAPLPEPIAELCRREAALVEVVVDAAVTGDRQMALHALLLDPMINDIGRAEAILDDYLVTFAEHLPQFQET